MKVKTESVTPAVEQAPHMGKPDKETCKAMLNKMIEEETKMVKGVFRNYETPNGSAPIHVRKYPGIPEFKKTMQDGVTYEVPLYVARFLNGKDAVAKGCDGFIGTCSYGVHGFKMPDQNNLQPSYMGHGPNGEAGIAVPIVGITKRVRRYGFDSMEFN